MFKVGDYIIYGSNGVCVIDKVGKLDVSMGNQNKSYYTMTPFFTNSGTIFTPVDNDKVLMRSVISKQDVMDLIQEIPSIDHLSVQDEKKREVTYKECIRKNDCRELVKIIKTIDSRKASRIAEGKKIPATEDKYFRIAEDSLYGEFAISLKMSREEAKAYVGSRFAFTKKAVV